MCLIIDYGQQPMKMHTEITLLYKIQYSLNFTRCMIGPLLNEPAEAGSICSMFHSRCQLLPRHFRARPYVLLGISSKYVLFHFGAFAPRVGNA